MSLEITINIPRRMAYADDGDVFPVTNWFDDCGEECEPEEAKTCVAGPMADGWWVTMELLKLPAFN